VLKPANRVVAAGSFALCAVRKSCNADADGSDKANRKGRVDTITATGPDDDEDAAEVGSGGGSHTPSSGSSEKSTTAQSETATTSPARCRETTCVEAAATT
jgi:hypothetical protein